MMKAAQYWDDGVATDARVVKILRKYNAKATFNLCPGMMTAARIAPFWVKPGIGEWRKYPMRRVLNVRPASSVIDRLTFASPQKDDPACRCHGGTKVLKVAGGGQSAHSHFYFDGAGLKAREGDKLALIIRICGQGRLVYGGSGKKFLPGIYRCTALAGEEDYEEISCELPLEGYAKDGELLRSRHRIRKGRRKGGGGQYLLPNHENEKETHARITTRSGSKT